MGLRVEVRETMYDGSHAAALESVLRVERGRLVRWCAYLTGNVDVAEDLTQETLSAAWRSTRRPEHPDQFAAWLAGIARNICHSWRRSQQRELAHRANTLSRAEGAADEDGSRHSSELADSFDLLILLERNERALLLGHALALLPPETRQALTAKYIEESSLAEVAARMGASESAIAARLHRGKIALRRILTHELRAEAIQFGLVAPDDDGWHETRIWCPVCAQHRLVGRLEHEAFALRCPLCYEHTPIDFARWHEQRLFAGLSSYRSALSRLARSALAFYQQALREGSARCRRCGGQALARQARPHTQTESVHDDIQARVLCPACGARYTASFSGLILCHAEVQRFWRAHPRMLTLPNRALDYGGRPATLTTFASWDEVAQLEVISDSETFDVLHVGGTIAQG
jgi:RNA polymerase sigma-70 factor (ECF subfamily)